MVIDEYNGLSNVHIASEMGQGNSFLSIKENEYERLDRVCVELKISDVIDQEGLLYQVTSLPAYLNALYVLSDI
jgi:hypothetical protein